MAARYLTAEQARAFYDRFGARQDSQAFYEDPALDVLVREGRFEECTSVLEIGCGTGRLAERLLREVLPGTARYAGCDISSVMIELARARLERFGDRVVLWQCDAEPDFTPACPPVDRIVATYVMDLLSDAAIDKMLAAAAAALRPGGLLCTASLTHGPGPMSRLTSCLWALVARLRPRLVGGCRPIALRDHLDDRSWRVAHHCVVTAWSIPSEVVVAERTDYQCQV